MDYAIRIFKKSISLFIVQVLIFNFFLYPEAGKGWNIRKSHHFLVYYKSADNSFLNRLIQKAEDGYRNITEEFGFFRDEPWVWKARAEIYVYDNKEAYIRNTNMPEWSGGCARPLEKKIYTYAEAYQFIKYTLAHELAHLIFTEFVEKKKVPLWLDEGVAVYIEKENDWYSLKNQMAHILSRSEQIPFEEILEAEFSNLDRERDPSEELSADNYVKKFYLESWSIVYFLIKKYGKDEFRQLVRNIRQGLGFNDSFFRTYRSLKDMEEFKEKWKEYYR